jgi:hypothetical protein
MIVARCAGAQTVQPLVKKGRLNKTGPHPVGRAFEHRTANGAKLAEFSLHYNHIAFSMDDAASHDELQAAGVLRKNSGAFQNDVPLFTS